MLVPWRPGDPIREESWQVVRPYLKAFNWAIFTGDKPGPWSRAGSVNLAAKTAGKWDVAVIADADTVPEEAAIHNAVEWVCKTKGGARPHNNLWRLTPHGSKILALRGPEAMQRRYHTGTFLGGGLLVVHREGWEATGGFDEKFVEWGWEDSAFNTELLVKAAWDRLPGNAWHLWHPRADLGSKTSVANRKRYAAFEAKYAKEIKEAARIKRWGREKIL